MLNEDVAKIMAAALFKYANPDCGWQGDQLALAISTFMAPAYDVLQSLADAGYSVAKE